MRGPWLSSRVLKGEFCRGKLEKLERNKYEMQLESLALWLEKSRAYVTSSHWRGFDT